MTARTIMPVLPQEDPKELEDQIQQAITAMKPRNPLELDLVCRAVRLSGEIDRAERVGTAHLAHRVRMASRSGPETVSAEDVKKGTFGAIHISGRPQPSTTVRAGCNARFLLREVHDSGALTDACTGKGPQMANPRPTPKPGNLGPPWPPGTSGNRAGYSCGRRISDAIDRLIEEMAPDREFGATARRLECRERSYVQ